MHLDARQRRAQEEARAQELAGARLRQVVGGGREGAAACRPAALRRRPSDLVLPVFVGLELAVQQLAHLADDAVAVDAVVAVEVLGVADLAVAVGQAALGEGAALAAGGDDVGDGAAEAADDVVLLDARGCAASRGRP